MKSQFVLNDSRGEHEAAGKKVKNANPSTEMAFTLVNEVYRLIMNYDS